MQPQGVFKGYHKFVRAIEVSRSIMMNGRVARRRGARAAQYGASGIHMHMVRQNLHKTMARCAVAGAGDERTKFRLLAQNLGGIRNWRNRIVGMIGVQIVGIVRSD